MYLRIAVLPLALLCLATSCLAYSCRKVPGELTQIDVGIGQVFGVSRTNTIHTRYGEQSWVQLPGLLKHVTVGPAGVWGVNNENKIFKLVAGHWVVVPGLLKQIDAGGDQFVSGTNHNDAPVCLNKAHTYAYRREGDSADWTRTQTGVHVKYVSCGPDNCWAVDSADKIYIKKGPRLNTCRGRNWQSVQGELSLIEVGTDGSVYGVTSGGDLYRRDGMTKDLPEGITWTKLELYNGQVKHVSYDLGHLWIILKSGDIYDCALK